MAIKKKFNTNFKNKVFNAIVEMAEILDDKKADPQCHGEKRVITEFATWLGKTLLWKKTSKAEEALISGLDFYIENREEFEKRELSINELYKNSVFTKNPYIEDAAEVGFIKGVEKLLIAGSDEKSQRKALKIACKKGFNEISATLDGSLPTLQQAANEEFEKLTRVKEKKSQLHLIKKTP